jgi:oligoendopeptidase F
MNNLYAPSRWDLHDILGDIGAKPGTANFEERLAEYISKLLDSAASLEGIRSQLTAEVSTELFFQALKFFREVIETSSRLSSYAYLWYSEDTQNPDALNLQSRLDPILTDVSNRTLFFSLWFQSLPDDVIKRLMDASGDERYFLESLCRFKPHMLNEREEQIINYKDVNGMEMVVKLYNLLTSRFSFTLEVDGEKRTLTRDELTSYYHHPSAELRAATYQELFRQYTDYSTIIMEIYSSRVRDWHDEQIELRGYRSPIAVRNLANDLTDPVVDTLLSVCRQNNGIFQHYFQLKAQWLGMERLRRYDIYAPLASSMKSYPFSSTVKLILDAFNDFSPQMTELAERVLQSNHLDAEVRPGKLGGAFCLTVLPELTPWVTVNYAGTARDAATLAHELGHAVHGMLSAHHSMLVYQPAMPLAETASVFAEMLLTERLLKQESDPDMRRDLIAYAIGDAWATVQRQAYLTLFEQQAHTMINEGRSMDELNQAYLANLTEQFGDAVILSDEFKWEWLLIPHIFDSPFYTYSYSYGQLLVFALYQRYQKQGAAFIPGYFKILAYGGSASPETVMQEAGIDITSPDFWQGGYDVLKGMVDELEKLA